MPYIIPHIQTPVINSEIQKLNTQKNTESQKFDEVLKTAQTKLNNHVSNQSVAVQKNIQNTIKPLSNGTVFATNTVTSNAINEEKKQIDIVNKFFSRIFENIFGDLGILPPEYSRMFMDKVLETFAKDSGLTRQFAAQLVKKYDNKETSTENSHGAIDEGKHYIDERAHRVIAKG